MHPDTGPASEAQIKIGSDHALALLTSHAPL